MVISNVRKIKCLKSPMKLSIFFKIIVNQNQVDSEAATIPMKCNYYLHKVSIFQTGKSI